MKISQVIKVFRAAQKQYGDVSVMLLNEETGRWEPIAQISKLHPYTAKYGCLNRAEPVNGIALSRRGGNAPDLVLANPTADRRATAQEKTHE